MLAIALMLAAPVATAAPAPLTIEGRAGNLMVVQLWSDDSERFMRQWSQPSPPNLTTSNTIERNKPITAFIIFAGCKGDAAGKCNLTGDVVFRDPDGKIYGEQADLDVWSGPAMDGFNLRLSPLGPAMIVEDGEKLGDYTVRISVTDRNAGVTAATEATLTVVEAGTK